MDKKTLQYSILEKSYQSGKWLDVLKEYFGVKKIHQQPQSISLPSNEIAEHAVELGSFYTSDERLVGIYEVQLRPKAVIGRNRVGLRNLLRNVYKYDVDAALIVFILNEKWRFSYVSEIRTEDGKKITEPKRYTYLFGEGESCRTAADRFDKLKGKHIYLNDLFDAFSIEKLNKEFFKRYKEFYEKFWRYLAENKQYYELLYDKRQEEVGKKEKPLRDFSKKLLGRIVFLQFLQKKGWMGVPSSNKEWIGGSTKFLQTLYAKSSSRETFHSTELRTLFFETLNIKRENDLAPESLGKMIRIPYLNGGLFDKDISFENIIDFPENLFAELLDFFEQYNFTIDENDPYDSEVGIDPEMLGHIFENLLEENREKGAFYTPKEIVHYMCHESLIQYLRTHLPECTEDDSPATKTLENFIRNGIIGDRNDKKDFVVQQANRIEKLLDNVKICDPAIGSGAFPMGILQEIFRAKTSLDLTLDPAEVKRQIIQNNIYGVDIEPGAVDIARLRFWLALVVDETEPAPLPNLDYKIMQGNSLLEQFEDISLKFEKKTFEVKVVKEVDLFGKVVNPQITISEYLQTKQHTKEFDITELEEKYFNADNIEEKRLIREKIESFEKQFILEQLNEREKQVRELLQHKENDFEKDLNAVGEARAAYLRKGKKSKEIEKQKAELEKLQQYRKRLNEIKPEEKPWFLWHLYFMDVFNKGGFDIVIGNPPYIEHKKLKDIAYLLKPIYKVYSGSSDISAYFYELGFNLLKKNGTLQYISSNKFFNTGYGKELRKYLLENRINNFVNFEQVEVFEGVLVSSVIFSGSKDFPVSSQTFKYTEFYQDKNWKTNFNGHIILSSKSIKQNSFDDSEWSFANDEALVLRKKIEAAGIKIKGYKEIDIKRGVTTGYDPAFIISEEIKDQLNDDIIKPLLKGREIKKFKISRSGLYLIFTRRGIDINKHRSVKNYLLTHQNQLEPKTDKNQKSGRKPGDYKWFEIQDNTAYFKYLEENKIIWPLTADKWGFTLDLQKHYLTSGAFFLVSQTISLNYILGVLNSKLMEYYFKFIGVMTAGGAYTLKKATIEEFPLAEPKPNDENRLKKIVDKILILKKGNLPTNQFENKIDALVFHLYGLTENEMLQVLDTFNDLSMKDKNTIHNEYRNIKNNHFKLEI